jgi:hypothetical protein
MKKEVSFYNLIKDKLPGSVERVENSVDDGMPDVSCAYYGKDYWIELKVDLVVKPISSPFDLLRASQKAWHIRRAAEGSIIFVLVRTKHNVQLFKKQNTTPSESYSELLTLKIPCRTWKDLTKIIEIELKNWS